MDDNIIAMDIAIISPGRKHDPETGSLIAEYEKRLRGRFEISWVFPKPGDIKSESAAISGCISDRDIAILLDGSGKEVSSEDLAKLMDRIVGESPKRLVFIIGGAYGVDSAVKERADHAISLSRLTFPHMLVRLILMEQIYRASEISRGGKYHHA